MKNMIIHKRLATTFLISALTLQLTACGQEKLTEIPEDELVSTSSNDSGKSEGNAEASTAGSSGNAGDSAEKVVTISLANGWESLSVFGGSDVQYYVCDLIYDTLAYVNQDGSITPRLLESWEFNDAHDVLTAKVDPRASWQDGEPVTADDVVFTYEVLTDPNLGNSSGRPLLAGTDTAGRVEEGATLGVEKVDDLTVRFSFKNPLTEMTFFGNEYATYMIPKHILEDVPIENMLNAEYFNAPVGSGQFKFVGQSISNYLELVKNEDYFLGTPDIDRLFVKVISNENVLPALISGEVDVTAGNNLSDILITDVDTAQGYDNFDVVVSENLSYQFAVLNTKGPLSDERSRRAIEKAINKQSLVDDVLHGYGKVVYSAIMPSSPYFANDIDENIYDPDAAKALLEEAGFDFGKTLIIRVSAGYTERERAAEIIQQNLTDIGVNAEIVKTDHATLQSETRAGNYDISLMGMPGTPNPSEPGKYWYSQRANNFQQVDEDDPGISSYWNAAMSEPDSEKAIALYQEAQRQASNYATYLYLYNQNDIIGKNKRIDKVDTSGYYTADKVYLWKVTD